MEKCFLRTETGVLPLLRFRFGHRVLIAEEADLVDCVSFGHSRNPVNTAAELTPGRRPNPIYGWRFSRLVTPRANGGGIAGYPAA